VKIDYINYVPVSSGIVTTVYPSKNTNYKILEIVEFYYLRLIETTTMCHYEIPSFFHPFQVQFFLLFRAAWRRFRFQNDFGHVFICYIHMTSFQLLALINFS
jgi:hypothetical protein